jgi:hypothetical protein
MPEPRNVSLIAHVDTELAVAIKREAESADVSTSTYLRRILERRRDGTQPGGPHAADIGHVEIGDRVLLDPVYGMERVLAVDEYVLGRPGNGEPLRTGSGDWLVKRLQVENELGTIGRFVIRFPHEPVLRWLAGDGGESGPAVHGRKSTRTGGA